jgi:hypothetical protein
MYGAGQAGVTSEQLLASPFSQGSLKRPWGSR